MLQTKLQKNKITINVKKCDLMLFFFYLLQLRTIIEPNGSN